MFISFLPPLYEDSTKERQYQWSKLSLAIKPAVSLAVTSQLFEIQYNQFLFINFLSLRYFGIGTHID